jgi:hypothetical protein
MSERMEYGDIRGYAVSFDVLLELPGINLFEERWVSKLDDLHNLISLLLKHFNPMPDIFRLEQCRETPAANPPYHKLILLRKSNIGIPKLFRHRLIMNQHLLSVFLAFPEYKVNK